LQLKESCVRFLRKFVWLNFENQQLVFRSIQLLCDQMDNGVQGIPALLSSLVENNPRLCQTLPNAVLWEFAITLERSLFENAPLTSLLTFFQHTIVPCGQIVREQQERVLGMLMSPKFAHLLLLYTEGTTVANLSNVRETVGYRTRLRAMSEYEASLGGRPAATPLLSPSSSSSTTAASAGGSGRAAAAAAAPLMASMSMTRDENGQLSRRDESSDQSSRRRRRSLAVAQQHAVDFNGDAQRLLYHVQLVELLSTICKGKNASCEAKCQSLLPQEVVLSVLTDPRSTPVRLLARD